MPAYNIADSFLLEHEWKVNNLASMYLLLLTNVGLGVPKIEFKVNNGPRPWDRWVLYRLKCLGQVQ